MIDRIQNIVNFIVKEIMKEKDISQAEKDIVEGLLERGYNFEEIDNAFCWIFSKLKTSSEQKINRKPLRILSNQENYKLTENARSLLLQLYHYNYLSYEQFESVLSLIMVDVSDEVDIELLTRLISEVVTNREDKQYLNDDEVLVLDNNYMKTVQ